MCYYFVVIMGLNEAEAYPLAHQWTIAIGEAMVQYINFTAHEQKQRLLWNYIYKI